MDICFVKLRRICLELHYDKCTKNKSVYVKLHESALVGVLQRLANMSYAIAKQDRWEQLIWGSTRARVRGSLHKSVLKFEIQEQSSVSWAVLVSEAKLWGFT